jgi:hypothetical protein
MVMKIGIGLCPRIFSINIARGKWKTLQISLNGQTTIDIISRLGMTLKDTSGMSLDVLSQYLGNVEAAVRQLVDVYIEHYEEEILGAKRANLRIRVRFSSGHLLELNEAFFVERKRIKHLGYRYHFQDTQNNLVFRYDNTPHFPGLENFPHHKRLLRLG